MPEFWARPLEPEELFEVAFRVADDFAHKGLGDQPAIKTLLGRTNRVLLGRPQTTDLLGSWSHNESLDTDIAAQKGDWDFAMVRLACSFLPDRGCRFTWARMGLELSVVAASPAPAQSVIAFDLFPREIIQTNTFKRSFSVKPALKFGFTEVSAALGTESDVLRYEPRVVAAGLLTDMPIWTFSAPARPGVTGIRELFLLLKKPKSAVVQARFTVGVEVDTELGPIPLKRYGDPSLIDRAYLLTP